MNAALPIEPPARRRKIHGLDDSALEYELEEWGKWIEENQDFTGYPTADAVQTFIDGCGGGIKCSRVLCRIMPELVQATQLRIMFCLSEKLRQAIEIKYVSVMNENGQIRSIKDRCEEAGIEVEAFEKRLRRARLKLLGLPADE